MSTDSTLFMRFATAKAVPVTKAIWAITLRAVNTAAPTTPKGPLDEMPEVVAVLSVKLSIRSIPSFIRV
jgi:hypothetical protein